MSLEVKGSPQIIAECQHQMKQEDNVDNIQKSILAAWIRPRGGGRSHWEAYAHARMDRVRVPS